MKLISSIMPSATKHQKLRTPHILLLVLVVLSLFQLLYIYAPVMKGKNEQLAPSKGSSGGGGQYLIPPREHGGRPMKQQQVVLATPVPHTPIPETPVPETPVPQTPEPETPTPETPAPETPVPETPTPETPAPVTEKPLPAECDYMKGQRIPPVVYVNWKTKTLFPDAQSVDEKWRGKEPCYKRVIVDDAECSALAERFPKLKPLYDAVPMNVMRADICRVLVVYYYGGIYMDLDVDWVKPFKEWFNTTTDILLGKEYDSGLFYCNWFFAAEKEHHCMRTVLEMITERIDRKFDKSEFGSNPWLVHETTGPKTFADALKKCGAVAQLNSAQVNNDYIKHLYGSQKWRGSKGYKSWNEERQAMGGWKSMLGHGMLPKEEQSYLRLPESELIRPAAELGKDLVVNVSSSANRYAELEVYGNPELAIDNYMESYSQTNDDGQHSWAMSLETPLALPTSPTEHHAGTLNCIRILDRRDGDFHHMKGMTATLRDHTTGEVIFRATDIPMTPAGILMVKPFVADSGDAKPKMQPLVGHIELTRGGQMSVAEVQLFTDEACKQYRRLRVRAKPKPEEKQPANDKEAWVKQAKAMYSLMATRTHRCDTVRILGEKGDDDAQWPMCVRASDNYPLRSSEATNPKKASIGVLATAKTVDMVLEKEFAEYGYNTHSLDRWYGTERSGLAVTQWGNYTRHDMELQRDDQTHVDDHFKHLSQMFEVTNTKHLAVLKLNTESREWHMMDSLAKMGADGTLDHLLIEMHACGYSEWDLPRSKFYTEQLQKLHKHFYLVGSRANDRGAVIKDPIQMPCCVKATFVRKALIDEVEAPVSKS